MSFADKLREEVKEVGLVTAYFFFCFSLILFFKRLFLAEYHIQFRGISNAIIGALIVAKVVVILDKTPISNRFQNHPVYIDVLYRSFVYSFLVFVVLCAEHAFDLRHEVGGFLSAMVTLIKNRDMHHFWAVNIFVGLSLIAYNSVSAVSQYMGKEQLMRLFFSTKRSELNQRINAP